MFGRVGCGIMKPHGQHFGRLLSVSLSLFVGVCSGCWKAGAQRDTELLAEQLKNEPGCVDKLRQWFLTVSSMPHSENSVTLPVPESLVSPWWRSAKAYALWGDGGSLLRITVTQGVYDPFVIIGAAATGR